MDPPNRSPRCRLALLPIALLPGLLLADIGIAWHRGWPLDSRIEIALILLLALLFVGMICAILAPAGKLLSRGTADRCLALLTSLMAGLIVAELTLQALGSQRFEPQVNIRPPNLSIVFHPDSRIMPGVSGPARYSTDWAGLRHPRTSTSAISGNSAQPCDIICLGGSTTECTYLDDQKTWPALLAENLRRLSTSAGAPRVGSAAVSGAAMDEHLAFVARSPLMNDARCLIVLAGINDLQRDLDGAAQGPQPRIWSRLAIPRLVVACWSRCTAGQRFATEDPTGRNYVARRLRRANSLLEQVAPAFDAAIRRFESKVTALIEMCQKRGAKPIFFTQPVLWSANLSPAAERLLWLGWLPDGKYLSATALRARMEQYNAMLMKVCRQHQVLCIDLDSMNGREDLFYDDCHFNEQGSAELANLVSSKIAAACTAAGNPGEATSDATTTPAGRPKALE